MSWVTRGFTLALLGLGLTAQSAPVTLRIVSASPLTGPRAATGSTIRDGAQMAVEESRSRLEGLGIRLEFRALDDQGSAEVGERVARSIVADGSVLGVVGHMNSGVTLATSPVYAAQNVLMVSPSNTNPKVTDQGLPNVNRVCGRDDVQGPIAAQFAKDILGLRRVFVVNDGEAYGRDLSEAFRARARDIGVSVVGFVTNPNTSLEGAKPLEPAFFTGLARQIKLYQPQAVYYGGTEAQGAPLVKALREQGFTGAFIGPDGLDNSSFITLAASSATGVYFTSTAGPVTSLTNTESFIARYRKRYGKAPETYSPYAYDAATVIINAVETAYRAAGNKLPPRAAVAQAARSVEFSGVTGRIGFDARGDRRVADYFVLQYKTATYPGSIVRKLSSAPPSR
jgi:branched-chain amino acid transport system substrate-binding protein